MKTTPRTRAVRAAHAQPSHASPVAPSIHLSTTFRRQTDGSYADDYVYTRADNPNRRALETSLSDLEGGGTAFAFASGMAAVQAVFQTLEPNDHVLIPDDVYFNVRLLLDSTYARWGLSYTAVDMTDPAALRAACRPTTKLIWVESPSNPQLKLTDVAAVTEFAHARGARVAVDNTWLTPVVYRPFADGADFVVHSTTKYYGGHSDVLGGATIAHPAVPEGIIRRLEDVQRYGGGVPAPFDCWLIRRGIPTLHLRAVAQSATALKLAEYLVSHPQIERVNYPGLTEHPGHDMARKAWKNGYGGMLSAQIRGGADEALRVAGALRLFTQATSLGGVESLVEHRKSVEGPTSATPNNLLRFSIGLEHHDDLLDDLSRALTKV